jgi:predicted RNase H-like HicB family nuclease
MQIRKMHAPVKYTTRIARDAKGFIASSPEYPECNGQGLSEEEAADALRESITLHVKDWLDGISKNLRSEQFLSYQAIYPPGMPSLTDMLEASKSAE